MGGEGAFSSFFSVLSLLWETARVARQVVLRQRVYVFMLQGFSMWRPSLGFNENEAFASWSDRTI